MGKRGAKNAVGVAGFRLAALGAASRSFLLACPALDQCLLTHFRRTSFFSFLQRESAR
jgi:hypothetical protein